MIRSQLFAFPIWHICELAVLAGNWRHTPIGSCVPHVQRPVCNTGGGQHPSRFSLWPRLRPRIAWEAQGATDAERNGCAPGRVARGARKAPIMV